MLRLHTLCRTNNNNLHKRFILSAKFRHSIMPTKLLLNTNHLLPSSSPSVNGVKLLHTHTVTFCSNSAKPISSFYPFSAKSFNLSYSTLPSIPPPDVEEPLEESRTDVEAPLEELIPPSGRLSLLMRKLAELRIKGYEPKPGQYNNISCPMCKDVDEDKNSLNLHISADGNTAVWHCSNGNCGWEGNTMAIADVLPTYGRSDKIMKAKKIALTEKSLSLTPLSDELLAFFAERMISPTTLRRNFVMQKNLWGDKIAVAFTYRRDGVLVSCKYRDEKKKFWQEPGCEKILYGLDDIKDANEIIIVEGEMDKLAMEEAGFLNCVSVPDGAPPKVSDKQLPSPDQDTKYEYLWNCKEYFRKASRIILATDGDQPGQALAEELARRLGRERCWRVKWPKKNETDYFKDANEVLMYMGRQKLKETIEKAELYPIQGLFTFRDYFPEIDAYYHRVLGDELGVSTGWKCLDAYYNVVPGELTIVTGIPNSGKSEWIDSLLCNLNQNLGWKFALCSMENKVREHARKLLEKQIKKPFFNVRYGETVERMTVAQLEQGKEWLDNTFHLIRSENDSLPNIKWVLDLAKAAVLRHGIRGLVIDPYNELDHQRHFSMTETEYVSQMLTMVKRFAQHHSCHVWFVAHPRQLQSWSGDAPNLYDISGSAHFINKCDNGIVVHRNRDPAAGPIDRVQICVRKVRNKVAGTIGEAFLTYNRITGEYVDLGS
ncbi:twinkle homolog protein, chloroplastic/mitochondrial-like [Silene latifolia]|uniref:twinkle homolog protein, chloroplastic/mitochondrial-like n=1 Tax=Silene latifolia TaxID=37657 RepID=UPI003D77201D